MGIYKVHTFFLALVYDIKPSGSGNETKVPHLYVSWFWSSTSIAQCTKCGYHCKHFIF